MKITEIADNIRKVETKKNVTFLIFIAADYLDRGFGARGIEAQNGTFILEDGTQFKIGENGTVNHYTKINNYTFEDSTQAKNYATAYANAYPSNYSSTQYLDNSSLSGNSWYVQRNWFEITISTGTHQIKFPYYYDSYTSQEISTSFEVTEDKKGKKLVIYNYMGFSRLPSLWL